MLTEDQIAELKYKYGLIFAIPFKGKDIIFRPITFAEYDKIILHKEWSNADFEEAIFNICVVDVPDGMNLDRLPAGVVSSAAEEILNVSGFADPKPLIRILREHRNAVAEARGMMKAFVLAVMPAYTEEDLDAASFWQLAKKVALAEKIIEVQQAILTSETPPTLDLVDPEEEAKKHAMAKQKHASSKTPGQAGMDDPIAQRLHGMAP